MLYKALKNSLLKNAYQEIVFQGKIISYQWLLQESRKLSIRLKGSKYGIYCNNKLNCIIAILACLQRKCTIVLLCPEYGENFNKNIIEKAEIKNYITDEESGKLKICTKELLQEKELEDVAFIIYTSGSTGSAKGVLLTQENIYANIKSTLKYYSIQKESTVLLYRPIYHTTTVFGELFTSVIAGAKLYIEQSSMPLPYLVRRLQEFQITNLAGTPTFFTELLKAGRERKQFSTIEVISVGGECMMKKAETAIKNGFPNAKVYHCYGMTEASPRVLYLPPNYFGKQYQCVGIPLDGVKVKLIDAQGRSVPPLPEGRRNLLPEYTGELLVSGLNIMKGYYKEKEATEKVLQNGWYFTGDCGYTDEKGFYYIIGRKDRLCIRAGVNIWPGDIEEAISRHPCIEAVYVYMESCPEKKELIAQISGKSLSWQEIMKWCIQNLPKPYIPDKIVIDKKIEMFGCGKRRV